MASLKRSQRVFDKLGYIGNFLERPIQLGDILFQDDYKHLIVANIEDLIDGFTWDDKVRTGKRVNLNFAQESNVSVNFGGTANVELAEGEVALTFGARNSAFVSLNDVTITELELESIKQPLVEIWESRGFNKSVKRLKYQFVSSIVSADSGTVIYSSEKNNKVVLKARTNETIGTIKDLGSGNFEYVSNSKSTLEVISRSPIQPMFQSLRLRKKNEFEIVS